MADLSVASRMDRGLFASALRSAGYRVFAVNPFSASRYEDRHSSSGAKSDPGAAEVLADFVRTDSRNHREIAGDGELVEAVKILARAHQSMIWSRRRQTSSGRSILREYNRAYRLPSVTTWTPRMSSYMPCLSLHQSPGSSAIGKLIQ